MKTFKELKESINEARKYSVLDTKKNQIVSRPNITKAAAQKLVDKDPENRIMGSPEFIHDKRTAALKEVDESVELDEYGVMGKRAFKRKEHEFEAEMERKAAARKSAGDRLPRVIYINNKVWKKGGKPVEFKDLRHAQNVIRSLKKKNPDSEYFSIVADMYKSIGDVYKESIQIEESAKRMSVDFQMDVESIDIKKFERKYKVKVKDNGDGDVTVTGKQADIKKALMGSEYGMDADGVEELFPELF